LRSTLFLTIITCVVFSAGTGLAGASLNGDTLAPDSTYQRIEKPGVILALSGGGMRGIAHIGVIKALEEAGIPIAGIAGTSIGAIVGGLYAAGYSVTELQQFVDEIEWSEIFLDLPSGRSLPLSNKSRQTVAIFEVRFEGALPYIPSALTAGQQLATLLTDKINHAPYRGEPNFNHLKVPFIAVSTDLETGERKLFRSGDLAESIFASIAVPLLISPVHSTDFILIDGGIAENIPVYAAQELGDFIIAVDASTPPVLGPAPYEPWEIANQVTGILQQEKNEELAAAANVLIAPLPDSLTNMNIGKPRRVVEYGYDAARHLIPAIKNALDRFMERSDSSALQVRAVDFKPEYFADKLRHWSQAARQIDENQLPRFSDVYADLDRFETHPEAARIEAHVKDDTLTYLIQPDHIIHEIVFSGVTQLDTIELERILVGDISQDGIRYSDLNVEALLRAYRNHGNPLATVSRIEIMGQDTLIVDIDEGRVAAIETEGLQRTSSGRILRDFNIDTGKPLRLDALNSGIDELYGSGLFATVRATVDNDTITIKVRERSSPRVRIGAGIDSERHGRGLAELSYEALPVLGGTATGWLKYAELDERYELTYQHLAIMKTYLEGGASLYSTKNQYKFYDSHGNSEGNYYFRRKGASVYLGQQFRTWGRLSFGLNVFLVRSVFDEYEESKELRKFFLRAEFDTQDRRDFPTTGLAYDFQLESAAKALGGDISYSRAHINLSKAIPITHRITFIGKFRGGICDQATPFSEWFRLGGETSLLGLHQNEIAGRQIVNTSIRIREDLISRFLADAYITLRWDFAAIWEDLETEVETENVKQALGISLELDTFLGPMSVSYGYLFAYQDQPARDRLYFNIGHRF
jgi:predicted acylesterase/phospholipase RssA/hemolysin activation/secretion protein